MKIFSPNYSRSPREVSEKFTKSGGQKLIFSNDSIPTANNFLPQREGELLYPVDKERQDNQLLEKKRPPPTNSKEDKRTWHFKNAFRRLHWYLFRSYKSITSDLRFSRVHYFSQINLLPQMGFMARFPKSQRGESDKLVITNWILWGCYLRKGTTFKGKLHSTRLKQSQLQGRNRKSKKLELKIGPLYIKSSQVSPSHLSLSKIYLSRIILPHFR